jgi:hypothetical protein
VQSGQGQDRWLDAPPEGRNELRRSVSRLRQPSGKKARALADVAGVQVRASGLADPRPVEGRGRVVGNAPRRAIRDWIRTRFGVDGQDRLIGVSLKGGVSPRSGRSSGPWNSGRKQSPPG